VPKVTKYTGIGHAVSVLNGNVQLAMLHSLGLISEFGPSGHAQSEREVDAFFGYGCIFSEARSSPQNAMVISTSYATLERDLAKHRDKLQCQRNSQSLQTQHIVFDLIKRDFFGFPDTKALPNNCNYRHSGNIMRRIFFNNHESLWLSQVPPQLIEAKRRGDLVVVLHVRRGDVLEAHVRKQRLVSFFLQADVVRNFLFALEQYRAAKTYAGDSTGATYRKQRGVSIFVITEQAPDEHSIIDYDMGKKKLLTINVHDTLKDACNESASCSIRVLTDREASSLQSFAAFCYSDVLMTTLSGFSHLAAMLCSASHKMVIGFPFWCSYESSPPMNHIFVPESLIRQHNDAVNKSAFPDNKDLAHEIIRLRLLDALMS